MKKLLVVMLLLYPLSALAETYQWTDERGTVNFTEDLGRVPKKYRKKAKRLGAEESPAPQSATTAEPLKAKAKDEEPAKGKKLFGGKDEAAWRNEFAAATGDLKQIETELAEMRGRLNDTSKMSRSEYLMLQNSIKNDENRLQLQKRKLEMLRDNADRYGVPAEYRQ
jgi:hypothetical protein